MPRNRPTARRVPLRAALLVDAPDSAVREAIRALGTWKRAATAAGLAVEAAGRSGPGAELRPGEVLGIGRAGRRAAYRVSVPPPGSAIAIRLDVIGATRGHHIVITSAPTQAGTLVTAEVQGRSALGRVRVLRGLQRLRGIIMLVATERLDGAPAGEPESGPDTVGSPAAGQDGRPGIVADRPDAADQRPAATG